ncbi:hypothetical protein ZWY2020_041170 [Hordeum vulgare]|nr:hypothetical protein ZWY2020_041170 [Hordeum vulgare]
MLISVMGRLPVRRIQPGMGGSGRAAPELAGSRQRRRWRTRHEFGTQRPWQHLLRQGERESEARRERTGRREGGNEAPAWATAVRRGWLPHFGWEELRELQRQHGPNRVEGCSRARTTGMAEGSADAGLAGKVEAHGSRRSSGLMGRAGQLLAAMDRDEAMGFFFDRVCSTG